MLPGSGAPAGAQPMAAQHAVHEVTNYWLGQGMAGVALPLHAAAQISRSLSDTCPWHGD